MKNYKVLIIVVTYNAMRWAKRCFDSLLTSDKEVDVFVIDNGSSDGTPNFITSHYPQFKFFQSNTNLGFGGANNIGLKYAIQNQYDYIYLLNQDAWIFPDTIKKLIHGFDTHKEYGILSPMQFNSDHKNLDINFRRILNPNQNLIGSEIAEVSFVMAAHWFMPVGAIIKVGGFSPSFFHYGEDNNYIDRMKYHGYKIGVVTSADGIHDRYERPITKEKNLYLKNTSNLIRLNNPNSKFELNLLKTIFFSIAFSIKNLSLIPLKGLLNSIKNLTKIRKNYNLSKIQNSNLGLN